MEMEVKEVMKHILKCISEGKIGVRTMEIYEKFSVRNINKALRTLNEKGIIEPVGFSDELETQLKNKNGAYRKGKNFNFTETVEYLGITVKRTAEEIYPSSTYVYSPYQLGKWNGYEYQFQDEWDYQEEQEDWFDEKEKDTAKPTCDHLENQVWEVSDEYYNRMFKDTI